MKLIHCAVCEVSIPPWNQQWLIDGRMHCGLCAARTRLAAPVADRQPNADGTVPAAFGCTICGRLIGATRQHWLAGHLVHCARCVESFGLATVSGCWGTRARITGLLMADGGAGQRQ